MPTAEFPKVEENGDKVGVGVVLGVGVGVVLGVGVGVVVGGGVGVDEPVPDA